MNLSKSFQIGLLTIVSMFFLLACKKKDTEAPILSVQNPGNNTQYYVLDDFIYCTGKVSDNAQLKRIEFQLQTNDGSPVMARRLIYVDSNPYDFIYGYELDDIRIESGSYKMKIEVFDSVRLSISVVTTRQVKHFQSQFNSFYFLTQQ